MWYVLDVLVLLSKGALSMVKMIRRCKVWSKVGLEDVMVEKRRGRKSWSRMEFITPVETVNG